MSEYKNCDWMHATRGDVLHVLYCHPECDEMVRKIRKF